MRSRSQLWLSLFFVFIATTGFIQTSAAEAPAENPRANTGSQGQAGSNQKDPAWPSWTALPRTIQAKVDPRILAELNGDILPAYLSHAAGLANLPAHPLQQTRFLVYLHTQADLATLQTNVYASQVNRRQAMLATLLSTAQTAQAGVKSLLEVQRAQNDVSAYQSFYLVNALAVEGGLNTLIALAQRDDVAHIIANYALTSAAEPTAAQTAQIDPANWNITLVGADRVWTELGITGQGAVVAGFDTGVDFMHPALVKQYRGNLGNGKFDHNYNWFEPDSQLHPDGNLGASLSAQPSDCAGHGTHTMGTSVGDGSAPGTQIGMAPGAQWIALPGICEGTMPGGINDDIGALKAFQWLFCPTDLTGNLATADCSKAPDVVNNSWGSANPTDEVLRPAIQRLRAAGIAPVFAAGNPSAGAGSIGTPANAPEAITVGATDNHDQIASFSGRGPSFYAGVQKPQVSAPGVNVVSSVPGGSYEQGSGTSMAAPHVTGLIALMVAADLKDGVRDLNVDELERFLSYTAIDLGKPGPDDDYGYGRINAYEAVRWVLSAGDLRGKVRDIGSTLPVAAAQVKGLNSTPGNNFATVTNNSGSYSITVPAGTYNVQVEAWGYYSATFTGQAVFANALSTADFALRPLPTATLHGIVRSGNTPVSDALIYVEQMPTVNVHSNVDGSYALPLPLGVHTLGIRTPGQRILHTQVTIGAEGLAQDFTLQSAPTILLVDADAQGGWFYGWPTTNIFQWALDRQNYQYDLWHIQYSDITDTAPLADGSIGYGIPSTTTLARYNLVIWAHHGCGFGCFAGGTPSAIGAEATLQAYLEHGGRLILSGQDIGLESGNPLFDHYLHADYQLDRAAATGDTLSGAGFLQGLNLTVTNASLYGYANGFITLSPDGVAPAEDDGAAYPVLTYDGSNSGAALAVAGCDTTYRAVYFAVGFENIGPRASERSPAIAETLDRSITWAMGEKPDYSLNLIAKPTILTGEPGSRLLYQLQLSNNGALTTTAQLTLNDNSWPSQLLDANGHPVNGPIQLGPCRAQTFRVAVTIPATAQAGNRVTLSAKATAVDNTAPAQSLTLTSVAFPAWQPEAPLPTTRFAIGAAALPNQAAIYTVGGVAVNQSGNLQPLAVNERYNACTRRWENLAALPEALGYAAVGALNDKLYAVGGLRVVPGDPYGSLTASDHVYVYDPLHNQWSAAAPVPKAGIGMAAAAANGKLYVFGGRDSGLVSDKTYEYDPGQNHWQEKRPLPGGGSSYLAAAANNGKIYVLSSGSAINSLAIYDPATDIWTNATALSATSADQAVGLTAAPDGFLYAISNGSGASSANAAQRYDPHTDRWAVISSLPTQANFDATVYAAGRVFTLGGRTAQTNVALTVANSFCQSTKTTQQTTVTPGGRITYTLTLNPDLGNLADAHLLDPLPANTTFVGFGINSSGASYNAAQRQVEWHGALMANQLPERFTYAVDSATTGLGVGDHLGTAAIFDDGAGRLFTRSITSTVIVLDLTASAKTVDRAEALSGDVLTYTIDVHGRSMAGGPVLVRDPLPVNLTYIPNTLSFSDGAGAYDAASHSILWNSILRAGQNAYLNTKDDYVWGDSNGGGFLPGVDFQWQDIQATGITLPGGDDSYICNLPIGFAFPFYGVGQNSFCVSSNGFIAFDPKGYSHYQNDCPLPNAASTVTPLIAALWDDLVINQGITYQTLGAAPNRSLVVQWNGARSFSTVSRKEANFQLILYENGSIRVQVLNADGAKGGSATIGLENEHGTRGALVACNRTDSVHDRSAILFVPPGGGTGEVSAHLHFQVTSVDGLGVNTRITNTATIATPLGNIQRSATTLLNSVDLQTSAVQLSRSEINVGEAVTYEITLRNTGLVTANNASLTLPLPGVTTYVENSLTCSSGQCNSAGNVVQWAGALTPNATVNVRFSAQLTTPVRDRTPVTSTLQLNDGFGNITTLLAVFLGRRSDISASALQIIPPYAEPGTTVSLVLYVRNTGSLTTTAEVETAIPAGLIYVDNSLVCGTGVCTYDAGTIQWAGSVTPRSLVPVRFQFTVPASAPYGSLFTSNARVKDSNWGDEYTLTATLWVAHSIYMPMASTPGGRYHLYLPLLGR